MRRRFRKARPVPTERSRGAWLSILAVCVIAGVLLAQGGCEEEPPEAELSGMDGDWVGDAPESIIGSWASNGRCDSDDAMMLVFDNGGYRWRKPDGSWGFARGYYSYTSDTSYRVLFKVRHLDPTPGYEAIITVSGNTLRKTNVKSNTQETYERCD